MKIGIVGGTGDIGEGMALRFSQRHSVIIGSRNEEKAILCCDECEHILEGTGVACSLLGQSNQGAIDASDIIILAIPYSHVTSTIENLHGFEDKIVISPINPLQRSDFFFYAPPPEGSAALLVQKLLPDSAKLCVAFNNIAATKWREIGTPLNYSVAICGDDRQAKRVAFELTASVPNLKPLDGGPLAAASMVESITPLLLNLGKFNRLKDVGVKFQ